MFKQLFSRAKKIFAQFYRKYFILIAQYAERKFSLKLLSLLLLMAANNALHSSALEEGDRALMRATICSLPTRQLKAEIKKHKEREEQWKKIRKLVSFNLKCPVVEMLKQDKATLAWTYQVMKMELARRDRKGE